MALGSSALVKEGHAPVWVWTALEQLGAGHALRIPNPDEVARAQCHRRLLVALVIGGNATIFSMAHGILAKPSPGVHATGLQTVSWVGRGRLHRDAHRLSASTRISPSTATGSRRSPRTTFSV